ncbi:unnamed protein product [Brachionus calyciflorus]|uniref:Uncharacterized protein n=1 Tax=Brachionus calyciflorus TaxID=104777 RepID=A0A813YV46_9BILA|nr:unnamed protein product [Brachionus calyciflorus]
MQTEDSKNDRNTEIENEIEVMKSELEFLIGSEVPKNCKSIVNNIQLILKYMLGDDATKKERINLLPHFVVDGMKCSLVFNFNDLKNIEISYKPTPRHNNYIYKSKEDMSWNLYQNVDKILDCINSARNILLFPKKRSINELQNQKNMKIFPLVPNDLVFSFYVQGFKLLLAIYTIKGNETTKHILECSSIGWLNNVIILLTTCLQILQQLKDKLAIFEPISYENN